MAFDSVSDIPSGLGFQRDSRKATRPMYSFGTSPRMGSNNMYTSKQQEKRKAVINSRGPIYDLPSSVGVGPKVSFTLDRTRLRPTKKEYPDSSVDLTCAIVDTQKLKFSTPQSATFGSDSRMNSKNAEPSRNNPTHLLGSQSPIETNYVPDDAATSRASPKYSFAPEDWLLGQGCVPRAPLQMSGTPTQVGPGSNSLPSGIGPQPNGDRKSAPAWTFGVRRPRSAPHRCYGRPSSCGRQAFGKQIDSSARTAPASAFGRGTRDQTARTSLVVSQADKGPAANMASPRFHLDVPPPSRDLYKAGM
mmetsp:Transcript_116747/g.183586  ORF Transcript_116747/g.183586 Transcript_116747/m.183586 type:complete len:304 (-) Transcript_116747:68-979(-)